MSVLNILLIKSEDVSNKLEMEEVKSKLCCGSANFDIQKLMLQRLNIPTIDVKKVKNFEKDSNHYWLLVSIDGGETYRFGGKHVETVEDDVLNQTDITRK